MKYQPKSITIMLAIAIAILGWACSPEHVTPNSDPDMGAFNLVAPIAGSDVHLPPNPECGMVLTGTLQMMVQGQAYPLTGTEYMMVNSDNELYISIKGLPGWVFYEAACYVGATGSTPPMDANGQPVLNQFTFYEDMLTPQNWTNQYTWRIDITSLEEIQTYGVAAVLGRWDAVNNVPLGTPFTIWINGKPVTGASGFTVDYQLALCPSMTCAPWMNATTPCCDTVWVTNADTSSQSNNNNNSNCNNPNHNHSNGNGNCGNNNGWGNNNNSNCNNPNHNHSNGNGNCGNNNNNNSNWGNNNNNSNCNNSNHNHSNGNGNCGNNNNNNSNWGNNNNNSNHNNSNHNNGNGNCGNNNSNNNNGWGNNNSNHNNGNNGNCGNNNSNNNNGWGNNNNSNNNCGSSSEKTISVGFDECHNTAVVSSNKKLTKVTLVYDDCTKESTNTNANSGVFSPSAANAGKEIIGIFVKNGNTNDCVYGEWIAKDGSPFSTSGCTCN